MRPTYHDNDYQRLAMRAFGDFSVSIAIPAVAAAIGGSKLDAHYQSSPKFLIICLAVALGLTGFLIVRKANRYAKEYQAIIDLEQKERTSTH